MKRLLLTLAVLMVSITAAFAAVYSGKCGDNVTYTLDTETGLLKIEGTGAMSDYNFKSLNGTSVTDAPWGNYYQTLKSVTISEGVTSIGNRAFFGCSSLNPIALPEGVTNIGGAAFLACSSLTSITIPSSVTSIRGGAFAGTAWYNNQPDGLVYAGLVAYNYKGNMPANTNIVLKDGTKGIADEAFSSCSSLASITIPEGVTSIGDGAFYECSSLTSVTIPNSVTSIGSSAFRNSKNLTNIIIPSSVQSVGSSAFEGCELRTIVSKPSDPSSFSSAFSNLTYTHATLYVPEDTYWDYVYKSGWGEFVHIKEMAMEARKVKANMGYMLADEQGCNYTVYDSQKKQLVNIPYTHALDEEDAGSSWAVVETAEGGKALFNLGARMYAAIEADGKFSLSSVPVTLSIQDSEQGVMLNGHPTLFVLNRSVDADAIKNIVPNKPATGSDYYTLDGKKASPWQKGIVIKDGRKVVR